jgi:hypothetical protein
LKVIGLIAVGCIAPLWALVSWSSYIDGASAGYGPIVPRVSLIISPLLVVEGIRRLLGQVDRE